MIYNKSWQGRFVSGRATALILIGVSLLMWLVGMFLDTPVDDLSVSGVRIGNVMQRCITFICFAAAATMMSSWYVFDRRIHWFLSLFFCLSGLSLFVHGCVGYSFSLLFFIIVIQRIFSCQAGEDCRYTLFSAFALFGLATMLFPQFITLLPVFAFYISITSLAGRRELLSILLGLLTPYWFLFGIDYIFPDVVAQSGFFVAPVVYLTSVTLKITSLANIIFLVVGLLVLIPFMLIFSNSASPGKPLLRKRLQFFALLNLYLMTLSLFYSQDAVLYYIWSLPSLAVMMTYIFSLNVTRFSRYYFVIVCLVWLAMPPVCLWLKL